MILIISYVMIHAALIAMESLIFLEFLVYFMEKENSVIFTFCFACQEIS